jgi:hypothetical protein
MDFRSFLTAESGAVTVDMVPLLAACVALGLAVMGVVSGGIENLSSDSSDALAAVELSQRFSEAGGTAQLLQDPAPADPGTVIRIRAQVP